MKTKKAIMIKALLISLFIIIQMNVSLAGSYVWIAIDNPDTLSVDDKSFSTNIIISSWNGNPGAYDISISFDPNILKIDSISISEESPIYMNCFIDTSKTGSLRMTGFNLDGNLSWDTIQKFATISWLVVSNSILSTNIDLEVNDLVESTWKPVEVFAFGQYVEINPTNTEKLYNTLELGRNYPNPFHDYTTIEYYLPNTTDVSIRIYDISGQLVSNLVDETMPQGNYKIRWDGKDYNGNVVKTGVYFYRMQAGTIIFSNKMLLIR